MDPLIYIRNGFVNPSPMDSHFYAACKSRHESSMIPKALKFATLQKKMAPIPPRWGGYIYTLSLLQRTHRSMHPEACIRVPETLRKLHLSSPSLLE